MQIVIYREAIILMFAIGWYSIFGDDYGDYEDIKETVTELLDKINYTILPEGHGELVDKQIIADYVHSHIQEINTGYGDLNQHTNRILRMIEDYIDNAPTIIEAESEEL